MKYTGIIKQIDSLGRFKIPKELLEPYHIKPQTYIQISRKGKTIVLTTLKHRCIFCFSNENIHVFMGKAICKNCMEQLNKLKWR